MRNELASAGPSTPLRQRVVLIIQKSNGQLDLDYENGISYSQLKTSSVDEFFKLFSEKSGEPLDLLDSLVFNFLFARERANDMTVQQGNEVEWRKLKELISMMFAWKSHKKPAQKDFKVLIEIGKSMEDITMSQ
jgi:hypothetical protein